MLQRRARGFYPYVVCATAHRVGVPSADALLGCFQAKA
ncbi:hypothetical protein QE368_000771 [Asaia bogorensis NBRC 16594]|nr:hypothetical protein [Asaia bogorensis NBRC 16594]